MNGSAGAIDAFRRWIEGNPGSFTAFAVVAIGGFGLVFALKSGGAVAEWIRTRPEMRKLKAAEAEKTSAVNAEIGNRRQRRALEAQRRKGGRP